VAVLDNPLMHFFTAEEREDGVYIKVAPDIRDRIRLRDLMVTIEKANIINADFDQIKDVVEKAHNTFERIGPPFVYYNPDFDKFLDVKIRPYEARLKYSSRAYAAHIEASEQVMIHGLQRKGIKHGIKTDVVRKIVRDRLFDEEFIVAEGDMPQDGRDGRVKLEVSFDPDLRPRTTDSGRADYRDVQTFTAVKEGDVIARCLPPTPGFPGRSVGGEEIPAKPGKKANLIQGRNTNIIEDGNTLVAAKTGVVYQDGAAVHVEELLQITGDIDFSVGHVKYNGEVIITGSVKQGFTVETEGNILINGEVESARIISRNGTVTIKKGVIGKRETYIFGKKGVRLSFAQEAEIRTDEMLTIDKYCMHCRSYCRAFESENQHLSIMGGEIHIYDHMIAANIGNENNVQTKVILINQNKEQAETKIAELASLQEKITKMLDPVKKEMKSKSHILSKIEGKDVTPRHKEELKKVVDNYNNLNMKLQYVEKKLEENRQLAQAPSSFDGYVKITGDIFPGVEIDLYGRAQRIIKTKLQNKMFKLHPESGAVEE
jgi:uncharacterized protein (DUF342 family)